MSHSPRKRYVRLSRPSSFEQKAGLLVLLLATTALALSLSSARDRLTRKASPSGPVAGAEAGGLGEP